MPPFDPQVFLSNVSGGRSITTYREKQSIYRQGDPADAVFYMQSGKARITVTSDQGKEAIVSFVEAGSFFGEGCLNGQTHRMATAAALVDCEITRIPKSDIVDIIHAEPAFAELFIAHLLRRNLRTEADLIDQLFNSSERRLARTLLLLANFGHPTASRARCSTRSVRRRWRKSSAPRARASVFS